MVSLLAEPQRRAELQAASRDWLSWDLTSRQLCDLELLLNGGFSPLRSFMDRADYESVCSSMRLSSGLLWLIPVTLDVSEELAKKLQSGSSLALRDPEEVMLAALHVEEVWQPDRMAEAQAIFGTTSREHPGVAYLLDRVHSWYVAGRLEGLQLPVHYDFRHLRQTPAELRAEFSQLGWRQVVAFQTRNPMHRAHLELTQRAARGLGANLLIHPSVGELLDELGYPRAFPHPRSESLESASKVRNLLAEDLQRLAQSKVPVQAAPLGVRQRAVANEARGRVRF